jgi:hypothetical protein
VSGSHRQDETALEEYNKRLQRAAAYDRFIELGQDWDVEGAEAAHRTEKEAWPRGQRIGKPKV